MIAFKIILPVLSICSLGNALTAQVPKSIPASTGEVAAKLVFGVLAKDQLNKHTIDDAFCGKWLDNYIESLDPMHLYFLDSDVSEFEALRVRLSEIANTGNLDICNLVTSRYKSRAEQSLAHAEQRIGQTFDFSIDEYKPFFHPDWPKSIEDRNERWRLQLKHDLLLESSTEVNRPSAVEFIKLRYASIRDHAQKLSNERAIEIYLDSFCHTADPYCDYVTQSEFNAMKGSFVNLGYRTGLVFEYKRRRLMVRDFSSGFQSNPNEPSPLGCEILAIRTKLGVVHNLREIDPTKIHLLLQRGLGRDSSFTLELYDEILQRRYSVGWLRKFSSQ